MDVQEEFSVHLFLCLVSVFQYLKQCHDGIYWVILQDISRIYIEHIARYCVCDRKRWLFIQIAEHRSVIILYMFAESSSGGTCSSLTEFSRGQLWILEW